MRLSSQFQACLFYFFWRKDFACTKTRHTLEVYAHVKNCCLYYLVLAYFSFVSWFSLVTCFCAREIFSSKKGKQAWNCLDNLILLYYWRVSPSTSLLRIYLRTLIFICDHLWESLLFMKIFFIRENLFFFIRTLFESFLSVRISSFYENSFLLLLLFFL